ncbi:hypothetical protein LTR16_012136, partial [Cryomyces antarcticus]
SKLYDAKGFDVHKWETLVEEANALRKEIKMMANEYDVEWDERADEVNRKVMDALKKEREKKEEGEGEKRKKKKEDDDQDD